MRREPIEAQITLRLPSDLKSFVSSEAKKNFSSQNSEIVRAIRERMLRTRQAVETRNDVVDHSANAA